MKENKETIKQNEASPVTAPESAPSELDQLRMELADMRDKYMRAAAEIENTRRRAAIDAESAARTRAMMVAENFLPLVDAINAACAAAPDDVGIETMARAATSVLAKIGITRIDTIGEIPNPLFHNAVSVEESPDVAPGTITKELQSGYMFGDSIIRPAMVIVAK